MKRKGRSIRRKVAVITGTRAEYGLLKSVMIAVQSHPRLELQTIVAGTHLLKKFGRTIDDIVRDGWTIFARVPMQKGDDDPLDQALGLARGVAGIARELHRLQSDIVVVLGDRIEAMAGALAAVSTGRHLAHIHGGDVAAGDFDDSFRHAITKLAHIHFTATKEARRRVIQMGEAPHRVHVVGAPGLDRLHQVVKSHRRPRRESWPVLHPTRGTVSSERNFAVPLANGRLADDGSSRRLALVVQHPSGRSPVHERRVMSRILTAIREAGLAAVCIYPNSDRGHSGIVEALQAHQKKNAHGNLLVVPSIDHDTYLALLARARLLIGNSSSGLIEAPSIGTPVVNVGPRQLGRQRDQRFVIDAAETPRALRDAIGRALAIRPITSPSRLYGDGRAGPRIAAFLAKMPLTSKSFHKVFVDRRLSQPAG